MFTVRITQIKPTPDGSKLVEITTYEKVMELDWIEVKGKWRLTIVYDNKKSNGHYDFASIYKEAIAELGVVVT